MSVWTISAIGPRVVMSLCRAALWQLSKCIAQLSMEEHSQDRNYLIPELLGTYVCAHGISRRRK